MRRLLWLALLAAAGACGRETPAKPAPEPGTLSDEWFVMRVAGQDDGYSHVRVVRRGEIVETTYETMREKRAGPEMSVVQIEEGAADGALLRLRMRDKRSAHEKETDVRFEGAEAAVSTKLMGQTRESAFDVPSGLLGPHWIEQLMRDAGPKPGTKVLARTFQSDCGLVTLEITAVGEEEVELLDGKNERLARVEMSYSEFPLRLVTWLDAEGKTRKTATRAYGLVWETYLASEERARRSVGGETRPPDIHALELLPAPHPIPCPRRLDRATYRVRAKGALPALADDRQSVETAADGALVLRIERKVPPAGHTGTRPIGTPPEDLASSLAPSSMVQSDAPEIAAIARDVAAYETDAWRAARALERWVRDNVEGNLSVDFASALEVARDRQGDCSECSLLLCALCRAAGIPARCTLGLEYNGVAWGAHAWNEVWIDGKWYALDATLGQGSVDPAHIALAHPTFLDTGFRDKLGGLRGDLEIDATEVVLNGCSLRPGEDPARIDGDRYENAVWALSFECPEGWRFEAPRPGRGPVEPLVRLESEAGNTIDVGVLDTTTGDDRERMWAEAKTGRNASAPMKVDGRSALCVHNGRRVYVLGDKGAFVFDIAGKTADAAMFKAFLATVDLDAK